MACVYSVNKNECWFDLVPNMYKTYKVSGCSLYRKYRNLYAIAVFVREANTSIIQELGSSECLRIKKATFSERAPGTFQCSSSLRDVKSVE